MTNSKESNCTRMVNELRLILMESEIPQKVLAQKIDVPLGTINGVLNYRHIPRIDTVEKLANGLIGDIVKKCTNVDSTQRYQDVGKIIIDLNYQEMKGRTFLDKILLSLPGIRSGKPVLTGLAIIGYLAELFMAMIFYLGTSPAWTSYVKVTISLILWFVVPLFCFHNPAILCFMIRLLILPALYGHQRSLPMRRSRSAE